MSELYDAAIIGAGPAGLRAAIELGKRGARVIIVDENPYPGGQLFKQIHKFFGSSVHLAGQRGFLIGQELMDSAKRLGVECWLSSAVWGITDHTLAVLHEKKTYEIRAKKIILATGATENAISFSGSTLPGVLGAGALQTMVNLHRVSPGRRILIVGSGNVGLIVAYQMLQAGIQVAAVVEASDSIRGYGVHAAKLRRAGVPILLRTTILAAAGRNRVETATLAHLDEKQKVLPETAWQENVAAVAVAAGLTPLAELAWIRGCAFGNSAALGGFIPLHDADMKTSVEDFFIAGDIAGIEEASTAMEEGSMAGIAAAQELGFCSQAEKDREKNLIYQRLETLRSGSFGHIRQTEKIKIFTKMKGEFDEVRIDL